MGFSRRFKRAAALGALSSSAIAIATTGALAGGFDIREQSAYFQGMSFAGSAAGGRLSSMFWNPAAASAAGDGITMESNYTLVLPRADITAQSIDAGFGPVPASFFGLDTTVDVGRDAVVPASYAAYRYDANTVFALSINSQFGLGTEPDNENWVGAPWARTAKLFSTNATPTISYQISPGITVGAGVQLQYIDLKRFKSGAPFGPSSVLEGDDFGVGFTAGLLFNPAAGTTVGLGFRSSIEHELEGSVDVVGAPPGILTAPIHADLELPEKITASFRQELSSNVRALGTVEWTNWSRLGIIPVQLDGTFLIPTGLPAPLPGALPFPGKTIANLDFQWEDGWFFSLGGEYDVNSKLTLRAGGAYEISPIREPSQRLIQLPDADRVWASIGATYKWSEWTSFDLAYSHVFVEDSTLDRIPASTLAPPAHLIAGVDASVDVISVGMKSKW